MKQVIDLLGRRDNAQKLIKVIKNRQTPFVIDINSSWGTGKSHFIEILIEEFEHDGFECIKFNAWENDFETDPIIPLIAEFDAYDKPITDKDAKEGLKSAGKYLIGAMSPLVKALPALLGIPGGEKVLESAGEVFKTLTDDGLGLFKNEKNSIAQFKDKLQDFLNARENKKPLIFIIDELDRCRPNFAIELLERVKHIFDRKNIVFIVAIDKVELGKAISTIYGANMDSDGYLRRFFDLDYNLPQPDSRVFISYKTPDIIRNSMEVDMFESVYVDYIHKISQIFGMTLRDIEKFLQKLEIVYDLIEEKNFLFYPGGVLIAMEMKYNSLYKKMYEDKGAELSNLFRDFPVISNKLKTFKYSIILNYYFSHGFKKNKDAHSIGQLIMNNLNSQNDGSDKYQALSHFWAKKGTNFLVRKIEEVMEAINFSDDFYTAS